MGTPENAIIANELERDEARVAPDAELDDTTLALASGGAPAIHPLRVLRCNRCGEHINGRVEGDKCPCGGTIISYIDTYGTPFV